MLNEYITKSEENIAYREIDGEFIIVNLKESTFHTLNSVASFIWQQVDGKTKVEEIIEMVCQEFEVDHETAQKDCLEFIGKLKDKELLTTSFQPFKKN